MDSRGILIVVSGFSGAGKGTLMNRLMEKYGESYALSVSATTRAPREGEVEGSSYFFKTEEEFQKMIANQELIEYANYVGNYYGTPKAYVEDKLEEGKDVILEIELQGALKVKEIYPDTLLLFVTPPSMDELERRLNQRGTETPGVIRSRIKRAAEEAQMMNYYDYLVINDDLEECVDEIHQIIQIEHNRVAHKTDFISEIQQDLEAMKGEDEL